MIQLALEVYILALCYGGAQYTLPVWTFSYALLLPVDHYYYL